MSGSIMAHCSSVKSEGYFLRRWSLCTMCAHSSTAGTCANYLTNLLFYPALFPDSLLVGAAILLEVERKQDSYWCPYYAIAHVPGVCLTSKRLSGIPAATSCLYEAAALR